MDPENVQTPIDTPATQPHSTRLWLGIGVIVFGVLAALDNMNLLPDGFFVNLWPLVLILFGVSRIARGDGDRGLSGYVFILGGAFLLVVNFGRASLVETIWPFFIVALGIFLVTRALRQNRQVPPALASDEGYLSMTGIFGGGKRRVIQQPFKGAEITAIFGGFELDLRQALPPEAPVRVDVFAMFGGGEVVVPQGWAVTVRATALAGGVEDKTLHIGPDIQPGAGQPHLVITGLVLFGGLTLKN